jgi:hypothetical protein
MALDFLATYTPLANEVATQTGLDPSVVLGIIDTETSGGTRVLGNNIFGISPGGKGGQYVAKYTDLEAGTEAFIKLMQQPRYAKVTAAADPVAQARALVAAGYNTVDPAYAKKVGGRALQYGQQLGYQDDAAAPGPAGGPDPAARPGEDDRMKLLEGLAPKPAAAAATAPATPAATPAATAPAARPGEDPRMAVLDQGAAEPPPPRAGIMGAYDAVVGAITGPGERLAAAPADTRPDLSPAADAADLPASAQTLPDNVGHESPLSRIIGATVKGATEGGGFYAPEMHALVDQGLVGRYITNPLLDAAKGVAGGLGGAFGQAAYEAGNLVGGAKGGRDANALAMVLGAHAAMPGVIRPGGPPVTPGGIVRNTLKPWEEARTPVPRYTFDAEPFRTREGNIEAYLLKQPPEVVAEMAKTNPDVAKWLADNPDVKTGTVEAKTAAERRQRFGDEPAPPETPATPEATAETPEQIADLREADRLMAPGTGKASVQPTRKAAGAAPTTEAIPEKTIDQRITDVDKDLGQTVADRAAVGRVPGSLRDDNVYIEGMPGRTEAHKDLSNQAAIDHKAMMQSGADTGYKSAHEANLKERNDHMTENVAKPIIGDRNSIRAAKDTRELITPDSMGVFRDQKPVDQALLERAHGLLDDEINSHTKSDPNRAALERIKSDLFEAGNTPSELRKVRKTMTDILERTGGSDEAAARNRQLRRPIEQMVKALDPVIQSGAARWGEWRKAWEDASRPINAQEFLEPYRPGGPKSLWDKEGMLGHDKVQRLLRDIAEDHRNPTGLSKGLTDDAIQAFVNMRNELAPGYISDVRGRVKGSSTPQMLEAQFKLGINPHLQTALETAAHLGSLIGTTAAGQLPVANIAVGGYQMAKPIYQRWKAGVQERTKAQYNALVQEHLLNEAGDASTPYPNPLTFKPVKPRKFVAPPAQP